MNEKLKNITKIVVGFITATVIAGWFISDYISDRQKKIKREKEEIEEKLSLERNIKKMVIKWNAIIDWDKQLKRDFLAKSVLTAELQEIFLREDKQPVLFFIDLKDIVKKDDNSYISYFAKTHGLTIPIINFVVDCNIEQYRSITSKPLNRFIPTRFAVIINVQDVYSSPFFYSENYDGKNYIDTGLIPTVKGICLDVIRVGLLDRDKFDLSNSQ
jgi:hypothetical protein